MKMDDDSLDLPKEAPFIKELEHESYKDEIQKLKLTLEDT